MMFPLVQELAAEGIPVSATCGVLRFSRSVTATGTTPIS